MRDRLYELKILIIAAGIGITTGIVASIFNTLILFGVRFCKPILSTSPIMFLLFPICGAVLTIILYKTNRIEEGSGIGIAQVLFSLNTRKLDHMRPKNIFWNTIATLITLISGMTAGRFGPIVHIGAGIGANIAEKLELNDNHNKLMIGCGAAGAIATVFNLPFFSTLFVMEVMFRERQFKVLAPLMITAVVSNRVGIYFLGDKRILTLPALHQTFSNSWSGSLVFLGIIAGIISSLYIISLESANRMFRHIKHQWVGLLLASLVVGLSAYFIPNQFEIHYNTTNEILSGKFGIGLLLILIFLRLFTTAMTLGSGFMGGNFYPGVTIGSAVGVSCWHILSSITSSVPNQFEMGILGIIATLSGFLHAPLACTVLAIEITGNSNIIVPALIVTAISVVVSYIIQGRDIFAKNLGELISKSYYNSHSD